VDRILKWYVLPGDGQLGSLQPVFELITPQQLHFLAANRPQVRAQQMNECGRHLVQRMVQYLPTKWTFRGSFSDRMQATADKQ